MSSPPTLARPATIASLSADAARTLMLAAQGLLRPPSRRARKADLLETIRRMGALQIDTIHVVARSPYFVLWSRLGDYPRRWLDELLAEGKLFEYWSHAACFLPIEDFPLYRRRMLAFAGLDDRAFRPQAQAWIAAHRAEMDRLLAIVRERGPVRSADFERTDGQRGGWWNWKPDKRALEMLHSTGELMIARRQSFQRVYDLRERVLPSWDDADLPSPEETDRALALKAVRALGITVARWLGDYFRTERRRGPELLESLANEGKLVRTNVEAWGGPAYLHPDYVELAQSPPRATLTTLLSPFDPLVWDRERANAVFDFDYRIECYTPEPKRRYGYFTLPILRRGRLIGRLDPKAHRAEGRFEVRALHLEPGVAVTDGLVRDLAGAIVRCARWHGTPKVAVVRSDPPFLAEVLQEAVTRD